MPLDQQEVEQEPGDEMTFLDHLEELRWHVIRSGIALITLTIVAFANIKFIFNEIIFAPASADFPTFEWLCTMGKFMGFDNFCIESIPFKIQSRVMTGQFMMSITASIVIGLVLSFPYIIWELWRFIKPGLYKRERKSSRGAVSMVSLLFFTGVAFGYFIVAPLMIYFLATYSISDVISNEFDITSYVGTIVSLVLGTGLLFQLPVVMYFLAQMGIVTAKFLRKYRKHSVLIILIVVAILTPSPDMFSQLLIALPLYLLFEISIIVVLNVERRKRKEDLINE